ncbi:MAG TPA: hypothetical protein VHA56_17880 [Mucilaginibacter sp.]|nr:hypothetical protein [Mucilaginibacter sp.]
MKRFITIILIVFCVQVLAQTNPVTNITIQLPASPDANTANWGNGNSLLTITATTHVVNGHVDPMVEGSKMLVIIKKNGAKVCGTYTSSTAPASNFNTITKVWSGNNATSYLGTACTLAPGSYEISVQFFSYNYSTSKMVAVSDEKTKPFTIVNTSQVYQPPQIITPANNTQFTNSTITQPISFKWVPVIPTPQGVVTYRLKIWQLLLGQTPTQAKTLNLPLVTRDVNGVAQTVVTNLVSGPCQAPYVCDFVYTVQALDSQGQPIGSNNGTSGMAEFSVLPGSTNSNTAGCATVSAKVFTTGDEIGLSGDFKLKLTAVPTGTNTALSGTGTVYVKWLGLLNVKFKDIKINGDNKLCQGAVYTNTDPNQHYPTQWAINVLNNTSAGSWTIGKIKDLSDTIKANKDLKPLVPATNQVNNFLATHPVNMPLGYFKGGDTTTAIGFTEMIFKPDHAEFEVIASLNTGGIFKDGGFSGTDAVALQGSGIEFTNNGLSGISGSIKLAQPLVFTYANAGTEDLKMKFNVEGNGHIGNGIVFSPVSNTFWTYNLDVNVQLPKEWLAPVDPAKTNVDMNFQTSVSQWNDFIIQGTLPACIIPHSNGIGIESGIVAYDHSSISNLNGMVFPAGYGGNANTMFTGFYLKNFKFTLPDQLRSYADTSKNIQVVAENLIIDKYGISGKVSANNVLNYPKANIGNLGASIDTVKIALANSVLTEASMAGKITLPLSTSDDNTSGINYSALFVPSNSATGNASSLTFALHPAQDITSRFLGDGKIQIEPTSTLSLVLTKSGSGARNIQLDIDLDGKLYYPAGKIIDPGSMLPMDLDLSCNFEHLGMTYDKNGQETFTFNPGHWSFASPQKKLSGFAFTITDVKPKIEPIGTGTEKQYLFKGGVELVAKINIGSENSNINISGDTKISLTGAVESSKYTPPSGNAANSSIANLNVLTAQSQLASGNVNSVSSATTAGFVDYGFLTQLKPKFLGVQVKSIHIESHMPAVYIKGDVDFYKHDPVYGNGFKGDLTAKFTTLDLGIQAGAIFGNTKYIPNNTSQGFKYWMVQAQVNLPPPGIIFLTGVAFRGFGAGVYSRMHMTPPTVFNPAEAAASTFGGAVFTPDAGVSMGFKAKAIIATTPKEETFNGSVALSAQFNASGGMNFIQFDGLFNCGAKIGNEADAFANGSITVTYNFPQKLFDMTSALIINKNPISTDPPGIQTKLHIDGLNNKWFFMSGTPTVPNKVKLFNVAINSYLMFGNDIQVPQGFMQETRDGFTSIGHSLPSFSDNATGEGKYQSAKGFAFGIGLNYYTSDSWNIADWQACKKCTHRYLNINYSIVAGGEIDASFLQYTGCTGLGKGWRAKASMAVYAGATLGYSYNLPALGSASGILAHVAGSAYATAEFPNPTFFDGQLDGDFSIGGYSVSFHKHFQSGSQCGGSPVEIDPSVNQNIYTQQNVSDSLNYILIKDIMIANGSANVSRTTTFGVDLNYPANEAFDMQEQQASGQIKVRTFRVVYTPVLTQDSVSAGPLQMSSQVANHVNLPATTGPTSSGNVGTTHTGGSVQAVNHTTTGNTASFSAASVISSSANNLSLFDSGYDNMGAKIYKRGGTGLQSLNVQPLKANTSYKFQITGELQEKIGDVWKVVNHKNTTVPIRQVKNVYFKTNAAPVSSGPTTQAVSGSNNALMHH